MKRTFLAMAVAISIFAVSCDFGSTETTAPRADSTSVKCDSTKCDSMRTHQDSTLVDSTRPIIAPAHK